MSAGITLVQDAHDTSYDEVPYESYPYGQTTPQNLRTIGLLFGMNPPKIANARILELGCAAGGNIIPIAVQYPKAEVVGIDLSKVQIDLGKVHIRDLRLDNIKLHQCSIMDIDKSFGKFDYIVAHGVLSWVPGEVQDKIFDICSESLSENGIAYISYNTLPGWNTVKTIRDMMRYHSSFFTTARDVINQSRLVVEFIKDGLEGSKSPHAEILRQEAKLIMNQADNYIFHDHLEETNKQYYFHEFMKEAAKRKLQYLSDTNISSMYIGNMPSKVIDKLGSIGDIVRLEQYMDFITNRRFRTSTLCHSNVLIRRNLKPEDIEKFYLTFNLKAEKPLSEVNLDNSMDSATFFVNGNKDQSISTSSPAMKAVCYTFAESYNYPLKIDEIVKRSVKKVKNLKGAEIKTELLNNAMRLVLSGHIHLHSEVPKYPNKLTEKPKLWKLAAYQARNTPALWLTNQRHERIGINLFEKYAFRYTDGSHTKEEILDKVMKHIKNKELVVNTKDGGKMEDEQAIKQELQTVLENTLQNAAVNALFC